MARAVLVALLLCAGCDGVFGLTHVQTQPDVPPAHRCFVEPFTGTTFDPRWTISNAANTIIAVRDADELRFEYAALAPPKSFNALIATVAHDFRSGDITAELVEPPGLHRETNLRLSATPTEYYSIGLRFDQETSTVPRLIAKINDTGTEVISRPWDPVNDHWMRIRIAGIEATFETSPDAMTWTGKSTIVTTQPISLSVMLNGYVTGDATMTEPANVARWDNVTVNALDCVP